MKESHLEVVIGVLQGKLHGHACAGSFYPSGGCLSAVSLYQRASNVHFPKYLFVEQYFNRKKKKKTTTQTQLE